MVCSSRSTRATPAFLTITVPPVSWPMTALNSGSWPTSRRVSAPRARRRWRPGACGRNRAPDARRRPAGRGSRGRRRRSRRSGGRASSGLLSTASTVTPALASRAASLLDHGAAVVGQGPLAVGALPLTLGAGRAVAQEDELHRHPLQRPAGVRRLPRRRSDCAGLVSRSEACAMNQAWLSSGSSPSAGAAWT